ncbi:MAG: pyridoxamine 5'-phosphate oxidase family protein [Bacteroidota bacterium]
MTNQEAQQKVKELIEDIKVAMLVTERNGELRSRPMYTAKVEDDHSIYFFTSKDSGKTAEIHADHDVNLAYAHPGKQNYLSISGKAKLVDDQAKMEELWSPMMKAWYPEGLASEGITLLRVEPEQSEFWEANGNSLVQLFQIGKAIATGTRYDGGEHQKVNH